MSKSARDRVLSAAASLSYVPHGAARMLVTRRSDAVAFVVCEQEEKLFFDPFFATVLKGVHSVVAASRRQLVFAVVASEADRDQLVRYAAGGHLDAAVFLSAHAGETAPARLRDRGVPVVLAGRHPDGVGEGLPHADTDKPHRRTGRDRAPPAPGPPLPRDHHGAAGHGEHDDRLEG